MLLQQLMRGVKPDSAKLICESLALVEKENAQRCVELGLKFMF
jgi:hypothetical protein